MVLFSNVLYESNLTIPDGTAPVAGPIRVNPQALLLTVSGVSNSAPEEVDQTTSIPIRVVGTKKYGIIARHLVLARIVTSGTVSSRVYRRVPIFNPAFFVTALSTFSAEITYEGQSDWYLAGGEGERYHLTHLPASV